MFMVRQGDREISVCWFIAPVHRATRATPGGGQSLQGHPGPPRGLEEPTYRAYDLLLRKYLSMKLSQRWILQQLNQALSHGMEADQA